MVPENDKSAAGVHLDINGDRVVGGTLRSDGTVRKTVKVRPGFVPQEDIQRYNVRDVAQRRRREDEQGSNKKRESGSRPSAMFNAINNVLKSNDTPLKPTQAIKRDGDELVNAISDLSISQKTEPDEKMIRSEPIDATITNCVNQKLATPATPKISSQKSESKKYAPPKLRKKKYTLQDLDNS